MRLGDDRASCATLVSLLVVVGVYGTVDSYLVSSGLLLEVVHSRKMRCTPQWYKKILRVPGL
jgi:hypothetical protein